MTAFPLDRDRVAAEANEVASESRLGPSAPHLTGASDRAALIAWLGWNDPNGDYDDPVVFYEGVDGLLAPGWYVDVCGEDRRGFLAHDEEAARKHAAEMTCPVEELWATLARVLEDC